MLILYTKCNHDFILTYAQLALDLIEQKNVWRDSITFVKQNQAGKIFHDET